MSVIGKFMEDNKHLKIKEAIETINKFMQQFTNLIKENTDNQYYNIDISTINTNTTDILDIIKNSLDRKISTDTVTQTIDVTNEFINNYIDPIIISMMNHKNDNVFIKLNDKQILKICRSDLSAQSNIELVTQVKNPIFSLPYFSTPELKSNTANIMYKLHTAVYILNWFVKNQS